jgi:hypothetical protein
MNTEWASSHIFLRTAIIATKGYTFGAYVNIRYLERYAIAAWKPRLALTSFLLKPQERVLVLAQHRQRSLLQRVWVRVEI